MKAVHIHLDAQTLAYAEQEAKRRGISRAEVAREIMSLGLSPYKRKHGKEKQ